MIHLISGTYKEIVIDVNDISYKESEKETTKALIKGVLKGAKDHGFDIGGFTAYVTSDVLIGAGLSSSAAFETVVGTIISQLYNDGKMDAVTIAIIGQYAENVYFGKPCGLMDQMACSVGSLVHVNFAKPKEPVVENVEFDMNKYVTVYVLRIQRALCRPYGRLCGGTTGNERGCGLFWKRSSLRSNNG